jgi:hypothetical protein
MARTTRGTSFRAIAKKILEDHWAFHPTSASAAGLHRFDGILPNYSATSVARHAARARRDLRALARFDGGDGLPARTRLELGVLRSLLLSELSELVDQRLPRTLPPYFLFRLSIENYLLRNYAPFDRRMRAIGKLLSQVPDFLRDLESVTDPRLADTHYELSHIAAVGILDAFSREIPEHLPRASPTVQGFVRRANEGAVAAIKGLASDLESRYKPRIKTGFALGRAKYDRMIYAEHLARLSTERLLEVGHADLKENQAAFRETARRIDPSKTPLEVVDRLSRDHPSKEGLIDDARTMLDEIRQFLIDRDIVTVPSEERAQVMETPRFYRFATAAMNSPGSFERVAKEAFYYVTPVEEDWPLEKQEEWLRHLNYTTLRNISVHECYPGHYVHFLHRERVTSTVLKSYYSYAFTEGWAHYCEEMMVEEGFGDARLKLAMLQDALLRDCRYISSIMMHTRGWSWEDATRFFMENAHLERLPAEREAKRGAWDPGYLNYTLGKLMIKKLRGDWSSRYPDASLREFHDRLLSLGAPPLGLTREHLLGLGAGPAL